MDAPDVSVILPVANQADHLDQSIPAMLSALDDLGRSYEAILVVNASRDATLATCQKLSHRYASVVVTESSAGWGRAVMTGLGIARGRLLCYTNSARTDPVDLALAIKYGLVNDDVVVKASRKVRDSLVRRLGSVIYNFECRMLFGLAVWDINGTPKVIPRSALDRLVLREGGDLIDLELIAGCRKERIPIVEIPVYPGARHGGRSTTNFGSALRMYLGALRLFWKDRSG